METYFPFDVRFNFVDNIPIGWGFDLTGVISGKGHTFKSIFVARSIYSLISVVYDSRFFNSYGGDAFHRMRAVLVV